MTLTRDPEAVAAARALRHRVFVEELGAVPAKSGLEGDRFDGDCDHLILRDLARPEAGVVATLRLREGTEYTEQEFDLTGLRDTGRSIAEVGRACLHPDYRGGIAGLLLFGGLLNELRARGTQMLVGTASFPGADPDRHLPALRRLRAEARAPGELCPVAHGRTAIRIEGHAPRAAMRDVPALIKTYLRAGAWVGDGAFVDRAFNTVDICIVLDMARARLPDGALRLAAREAE